MCKIYCMCQFLFLVLTSSLFCHLHDKFLRICKVTKQYKASTCFCKFVVHTSSLYVWHQINLDELVYPLIFSANIINMSYCQFHKICLLQNFNAKAHTQTGIICLLVNTKLKMHKHTQKPAVATF